jgi:hypothetical protein
MSPSRYGAVLGPSDLDFLQRVFDRICEGRSLSASSAEAETVAASLVRLWKSGYHDEETLRTLAELRLLDSDTASQQSVVAISSNFEKSCEG